MQTTLYDDDLHITEKVAGELWAENWEFNKFTETDRSKYYL